MAENKGKIKKGEVRNPNGRPKKGETLTDILREHCDKMITEKSGGKVAIKIALARKMVAMALSGDMAAIRYVYDRIDGLPKQALEHSGEIGSYDVESLIAKHRGSIEKCEEKAKS